MTTVAQLIAKLQTLDPKLDVMVLHSYSRNWAVHTEFINLDISNYSDSFEVLGTTLYIGGD